MSLIDIDDNDTSNLDCTSDKQASHEVLDREKGEKKKKKKKKKKRQLCLRFDASSWVALIALACLKKKSVRATASSEKTSCHGTVSRFNTVGVSSEFE